MAFKNYRDIAISNCFDKQYEFVLFKILILISFFVIFLNIKHYELRASETTKIPDASNILFTYTEAEKDTANKPTNKIQAKRKNFVNCSINIENYLGPTFVKPTNSSYNISVEQLLNQYYNVLLLPILNTTASTEAISPFDTKENFLFQPITTSDIKEVNKNLKDRQLMLCNLVPNEISKLEEINNNVSIFCNEERMNGNCSPVAKVENCDELLVDKQVADPNNSTATITKKKCYPEDHICYKIINENKYLYQNMKYNSASYSNKLFALNRAYIEDKTKTDANVGTIKGFYLYKKQIRLFDNKYDLDKGNVNCVGAKLSCDLNIYSNMKYLQTKIQGLDKYTDYLKYKNFISETYSKDRNKTFFDSIDNENYEELFILNDTCVLKVVDNKSALKVCDPEVLKSAISVKVLLKDNNTVKVYFRAVVKNCVGYLPSCDQVGTAEAIYDYTFKDNTEIGTVSNLAISDYSRYLVYNIDEYAKSHSGGNEIKNILLKKKYIINESNLLFSSLKSGFTCLFKANQQKENNSIEEKLNSKNKSYCSDLILNDMGYFELKYKDGLKQTEVNTINSNTVENEKIVEVINPNCYLKSCIDLTLDELLATDSAPATNMYCSGFKWLFNNDNLKYFSLITVAKNDANGTIEKTHGLFNRDLCSSVDLNTAKGNKLNFNKKTVISKKNASLYEYKYKDNPDSEIFLNINNSVDDDVCKNWNEYSLYSLTKIENVENPVLAKVDKDTKNSIYSDYCKDILHDVSDNIYSKSLFYNYKYKLKGAEDWISITNDVAYNVCAKWNEHDIHIPKNETGQTKEKLYSEYCLDILNNSLENVHNTNCFFKRCVMLKDYEFGVISKYNYDNKKNIITQILDKHFNLGDATDYGFKDIFIDNTLQALRKSLPKICENKVFFNNLDADAKYIEDFLITNPVDLSINLLNCQDFANKNYNITGNAYNNLLTSIIANNYQDIIGKKLNCINYNNTKYIKSSENGILVSTMNGSSNVAIKESESIIIDQPQILDAKFLKPYIEDTATNMQENICKNTDNLLLTLNAEFDANSNFITSPVEKLNSEFSSYLQDNCIKKQFSIDKTCGEKNKEDFNFCFVEGSKITTTDYDDYKKKCIEKLETESNCIKNCIDKNFFGDKVNKIVDFFINCQDYVSTRKPETQDEVTTNATTTTNGLSDNIVDCNLYKIIGEPNVLNFTKYTNFIELRDENSSPGEVLVLGNKFLDSFDTFNNSKNYCYNRYDSRFVLNVPDDFKEPNKDSKLYFPFPIQPAKTDKGESSIINTSNTGGTDKIFFGTRSVFCGFTPGISIQGCVRPSVNTYYINTILDPLGYTQDSKNLKITGLNKASDIGLKYVEVYTRFAGIENPQACGIRENVETYDFPTLVLVDSNKKGGAQEAEKYSDLVSDIDGAAVKQLQENKELTSTKSIMNKKSNKGDYTLKNYKYSSKKIGRNVCVFVNQNANSCNLDTSLVKNDKEIIESYCTRRFKSLTYDGICTRSYDKTFREKMSKQATIRIQNFLMDKRIITVDQDKETAEGIKLREFFNFVFQDRKPDYNKGDSGKIDQYNFLKETDVMVILRNLDTKRVNCHKERVGDNKDESTKDESTSKAAGMLFAAINKTIYSELNETHVLLLQEYKNMIADLWSACEVKSLQIQINAIYGSYYGITAGVIAAGVVMIALGVFSSIFGGTGLIIAGGLMVAAGTLAILSHVIAGDPEGVYLSSSIGVKKDACVYGDNSENGVAKVGFDAFTNVSILNNDAAIKDFERNNLMENNGIISDISLFRPEGYPTMYYNKSNFYQNIKEKMATNNYNNKLTNPLETISWNVAEKCGLHNNFKTYFQYNASKKLEKKFVISTQELAKNPEIEKCLIDNGFAFFRKQFITENKEVEDYPFLATTPFGKRYKPSDMYRVMNVSSTLLNDDSEDKNFGCGVVLANKNISGVNSSIDNIKINFIEYIGNEPMHNARNINCYLDSYGNPIGDIRYCRGIFALANQFKTQSEGANSSERGIQQRSDMNFDSYDPNNHLFDYFYPESQCLKLPLASSPQPFFTLANIFNTPDLFDPVLYPIIFMAKYDVFPNVGESRAVTDKNKVLADYFRPEIAFKYDFPTRDPSYKNIYESTYATKKLCEVDLKKQYLDSFSATDQFYSDVLDYKADCFEDSVLLENCKKETKKECKSCEEEAKKECKNNFSIEDSKAKLDLCYKVIELKKLLNYDEGCSIDSVSFQSCEEKAKTQCKNNFPNELDSCYKAVESKKLCAFNNDRSPIKIGVKEEESKTANFKYWSPSLPLEKEVNFYLTKEYERSGLTFVYEPKVCTNYLNRLLMSQIVDKSICINKDEENAKYCYLIYLKKYECYDRKLPLISNIYMKPSKYYSFNHPAINVAIFDKNIVHEAIPGKELSTKLIDFDKKYFENLALALTIDGSVAELNLTALQDYLKLEPAKQEAYLNDKNNREGLFYRGSNYYLSKYLSNSITIQEKTINNFKSHKNIFFKSYIYQFFKTIKNIDLEKNLTIHNVNVLVNEEFNLVDNLETFENTYKEVLLMDKVEALNANTVNSLVNKYFSDYFSAEDIIFNKLTSAEELLFLKSYLRNTLKNMFDIFDFGKNDIQKYGINFIRSECSELDVEYFKNLDTFYKETNLDFKKILLQDLVRKENELKTNCNIRRGGDTEAFQIENNGIKIAKINYKKYPEFYDGFNQICIKNDDYDFIKSKNIEQNELDENETVIAFKRTNAIIMQEKLMSNNRLADIKTKCLLNDASLKNAACLVDKIVYMECEPDDPDCAKGPDILLRKHLYDQKTNRYILLLYDVTDKNGVIRREKNSDGTPNFNNIIESNCEKEFEQSETEPKTVCLRYIKNATINPESLEYVNGENVNISDKLFVNLKKIDCEALMASLNSTDVETKVNLDIYSEDFDVSKIKALAACYKGGYNKNKNIYKQDNEKAESCVCETYNMEKLKSASALVRKTFYDHFYNREADLREVGSCLDLEGVLKKCDEVKYSSIYNEYFNNEKLVKVVNRIDFFKLFFFSNETYNKYVIQHVWRSMQKLYGYVGSYNDNFNDLGYAEFRATPFCEDGNSDDCVGGSNIIMGECRGFFKNQANMPQARCVKIEKGKQEKYQFELLPNTGCVRYICPVLGTSVKDINEDKTEEAQEGALERSNNNFGNDNSNIFAQVERNKYSKLEKFIPNFAITDHKADSNISSIDTRGRKQGYAVWEETTSDDFLIKKTAKRCLIGYGPAGSNYAREKYFEVSSGEVNNLNYGKNFSFYNNPQLQFYKNFEFLLKEQVNRFYNKILTREEIRNNLPERYCDQKGNWLPVRDIYSNLANKETEELKFEFYADNPNIDKIFNDDDKGILKESKDFVGTDLGDNNIGLFEDKDQTKYCERLFCPNITIDKYDTDLNPDPDAKNFGATGDDYNIYEIEFKNVYGGGVYENLKTVNINTPWRHTGGAKWAFTSAPRNSSAMLLPTTADIADRESNRLLKNILNIQDTTEKTKYMFLKKVQGRCEMEYGYYPRNTKMLNVVFEDNNGGAVIAKGSFDNQLKKLQTNNNKESVNPKTFSLVDDTIVTLSPTRTCNSVGVWSGVSDPCFRACEMLDMYHVEYSNKHNNEKYADARNILEKTDEGFRYNKNFVNRSFGSNDWVATTDVARILLQPDFRKFKNSEDKQMYTYINEAKEQKEYGLTYGDYLTGGAKWARTIVPTNAKEETYNGKKLKYIEVEGECDGSNIYFEQIRQYGNNGFNVPRRKCYEDGTWGPVEGNSRCVLFRQCSPLDLNLAYISFLLKTDRDYKDESAKLFQKLNETLSDSAQDKIKKNDMDLEGYKRIITNKFLETLEKKSAYTLMIGKDLSPLNLKENAKSYAKPEDNFMGQYNTSNTTESGDIVNKYRCDMGDASPDDPARSNNWSFETSNLDSYIIPYYCSSETINKLINSSVNRLNLDNIVSKKLKLYAKNTELAQVYEYLLGSTKDHEKFNTINNPIKDTYIKGDLGSYVNYKFNSNDSVYQKAIELCNNNIIEEFKGEIKSEINQIHFNKIENFTTDKNSKNELCKDINIGQAKYYSYQYMASCNKYFFNEYENFTSESAPYKSAYSLLECTQTSGKAATFIEEETGKTIAGVERLVSAKNCKPKICGVDNNDFKPTLTNTQVQKGWSSSVVKEVANNLMHYDLNRDTGEVFEPVSSLKCKTFPAKPIVASSVGVPPNIYTGFIIEPDETEAKITTGDEVYEISTGGGGEEKVLSFKKSNNISGLKINVTNIFDIMESDCQVNPDVSKINGVSVDKNSYLFNRQGALYLGTKSGGVDANKESRVKFCKDIDRLNCSNIKEDILQDGETFSKIYVSEGSNENNILNSSAKGYCIPLACPGRDLTLKDIEWPNEEQKKNFDITKKFNLDYDYYNFGDSVVLQNFEGDFVKDTDISGDQNVSKVNVMKEIVNDNKEFNLCKPGYNQYNYGKTAEPTFEEYFTTLTSELSQCKQYVDNIETKCTYIDPISKICFSNVYQFTPKYSDAYRDVINFDKTIKNFIPSSGDSAGILLEELNKLLKSDIEIAASKEVKVTKDLITNLGFYNKFNQTIVIETTDTTTNVKTVNFDLVNSAVDSTLIAKLNLQFPKLDKTLIKFYKNRANNIYHITFESNSTSATEIKNEKSIPLDEFKSSYDSIVVKEKNTIIERMKTKENELKIIYNTSNNKFKLINKVYSFDEFKNLVGNMNKMNNFLFALPNGETKYNNLEKYNNLVIKRLDDIDQEQLLVDGLYVKNITNANNGINILYSNSDNSIVKSVDEDEVEVSFNTDKDIFLELCVSAPTKTKNTDISSKIIEIKTCIIIPKAIFKPTSIETKMFRMATDCPISDDDVECQEEIKTSINFNNYINEIKTEEFSSIEDYNEVINFFKSVFEGKYLEKTFMSVYAEFLNNEIYSKLLDFNKAKECYGDNSTFIKNYKTFFLEGMKSSQNGEEKSQFKEGHFVALECQNNGRWKILDKVGCEKRCTDDSGSLHLQPDGSGNYDIKVTVKNLRYKKSFTSEVAAVGEFCSVGLKKQGRFAGYTASCKKESFMGNTLSVTVNFNNRASDLDIFRKGTPNFCVSTIKHLGSNTKLKYYRTAYANNSENNNRGVILTCPNERIIHVKTGNKQQCGFANINQEKAIDQYPYYHKKDEKFLCLSSEQKKGVGGTFNCKGRFSTTPSDTMLYDHTAEIEYYVED